MPGAKDYKVFGKQQYKFFSGVVGASGSGGLNEMSSIGSDILSPQWVVLFE